MRLTVHTVFILLGHYMFLCLRTPISVSCYHLYMFDMFGMSVTLITYISLVCRVGKTLPQFPMILQGVRRPTRKNPPKTKAGAGTPRLPEEDDDDGATPPGRLLPAPRRVPPAAGFGAPDTSQPALPHTASKASSPVRAAKTTSPVTAAAQGPTRGLPHLSQEVGMEDAIEERGDEIEDSELFEVVEDADDDVWGAALGMGAEAAGDASKAVEGQASQGDFIRDDELKMFHKQP